MPRRAFTLLELLVVISIIAVLAALLTPLIGIARKASRDAKCASQMALIEAALAGYKDANGVYPESYGTTPGSTSDIYSTTLANGTGTTAVGKPASTPITEAAWRGLSQALKLQLQTIDPDTFRIDTTTGDPRATYIVDPYGSIQSFAVYRYRPSRYYPFGTSATITIDGPNPPNPNSYQLWSCGWDGKDEFGQKFLNVGGATVKGDDICNWSNK